MKKPPPNGRYLIVSSPIRRVTLYAGSPQCWQAAKNDKRASQQNHPVLLLITDTKKYHWLVNDCPVVVIRSHESELTGIGILISILLVAGARPMDIEQINKSQTIPYRRPKQGARHE